MRVYRWDLDKTYLDTEFSSMRGLLRAALETADEKRNVPGSAALLRALSQATPDHRVSIISGSPTQMRRVLEEKLALDGVHFDHFVLKDSLGNLRRGRLRAVTNQLGYKLPALLADRIGLPSGAVETCFGDDVEVDALVYSVYADAVAGRLAPDEVARIMEAGGAYPDHITAALSALSRVPRAGAVQDIFIHLSRRSPPQRFQALGPRVVPVYSWLQAALVLMEREVLTSRGVADVGRVYLEQAGQTTHGVARLVQDAVRRGIVRVGSVERVLEEQPALAPLAGLVRRDLRHLGKLADAPRAAEEGSPDYLGWLAQTGA